MSLKLVTLLLTTGHLTKALAPPPVPQQKPPTTRGGGARVSCPSGKRWGGHGSYCISDNLYFCGYQNEPNPRMIQNCGGECTIERSGVPDRCADVSVPDACNRNTNCHDCLLNKNCLWNPNTLRGGQCVQKNECDYTYATTRSFSTYSTACIATPAQCHVPPPNGAVLVPNRPNYCDSVVDPCFNPDSYCCNRPSAHCDNVVDPCFNPNSYCCQLQQSKPSGHYCDSVVDPCFNPYSYCCQLLGRERPAHYCDSIVDPCYNPDSYCCWYQAKKGRPNKFDVMKPLEPNTDTDTDEVFVTIELDNSYDVCNNFSTDCQECSDNGCFYQPSAEAGRKCASDCFILDASCYGTAANWSAKCPRQITAHQEAGLYEDCISTPCGRGLTCDGASSTCMPL